jgi:hypothetical protein
MKPKMKTSICPVCGSSYQTPEGVTRPICGKPECVREARNRGIDWHTTYSPGYSPEPTTSKRKKKRR